jgi:hypothetical protein
MPAWERATSFAEYCALKKIDAVAWQHAAPLVFAAAEAQFLTIGPRSFDQQRKFQLMDWRWAHPLGSQPSTTTHPHATT